METSPTIEKQRTPPPIFVKEVASWRATAHAIRMAKINTKSCKVTREFIKIQPATIDDYRGLQKLLKDTQIEFFTFRIHEEKPIQVVIFGLPAGISNEEILEELQNTKSLPATRVYRIGKNTTVVHLDKTENGKKVYELTDLLQLRIRVEGKRRSSKPNQCFRCQEFGHSSAGCHLSWKCVRCGESHASFTCEKKDKSIHEAKCANCAGNHTANYKGCPKYAAAEAIKTNNKTYARAVKDQEKLSVENTNESTYKNLEDAMVNERVQAENTLKNAQTSVGQKETLRITKKLTKPKKALNLIKKNKVTKKTASKVVKDTESHKPKTSQTSGITSLVNLLAKIDLQALCTAAVTILEVLKNNSMTELLTTVVATLPAIQSAIK